MRISEWQTLVMKNFDVPASASGPIRAPCTHCSTLIAGTTKTPANFLKHLKRKHLSIFLELTSLKKTIGTSPEDYSSKSSTSFEHKSSLSPKKAAYPVDFKIRVLEYFLKNGGEANFGLKSKTAQLFNVDKKTINRMLLNHELVSMVEKALESGKSHSSIHHNRKKSKPNKCKRMDSENNSRTSSPLLNAMSSDGNQDDVPILELPEDPDYSILKKTIRSSSNEVGNIVQILASGTREVQSVMLQECDLILECKVCKALFRSLVNLLAHKRIYCTDKFRNVRNSYEQTNALGVSSESSSEMVIASKPKKSRGIDQIAERLASKDNPACVSSSSDKGSPQFYRSLLKTQENRDKDKRTCSVVLTAIKNVKGVSSQDVTCGNKTVVTSQSQNILQQANERKQGATAVIGPDGNVVSSFFGDPKDEDAANEEISRLEAMEAEPRETDTSTSKRTDIRSVSQDEERDIYTCPICKSQFLSVGGCLKHLIKVHKKKKQHRETLRRIILERSYKRRLTPEEKSTSHLKASSSLEPPLKKICLSEPKTISTPDVDQSSIREDLHQPSQGEWKCSACHKEFLLHSTAEIHLSDHPASLIKPRILRLKTTEILHDGEVTNPSIDEDVEKNEGSFSDDINLEMKKKDLEYRQLLSVHPYKSRTALLKEFRKDSSKAPLDGSNISDDPYSSESDSTEKKSGESHDGQSDAELFSDCDEMDDSVQSMDVLEKHFVEGKDEPIDSVADDDDSDIDCWLSDLEHGEDDTTDHAEIVNYDDAGDLQSASKPLQENPLVTKFKDSPQNTGLDRSPEKEDLELDFKTETPEKVLEDLAFSCPIFDESKPVEQKSDKNIEACVQEQVDSCDLKKENVSESSPMKFLQSANHSMEDEEQSNTDLDFSVQETFVKVEHDLNDFSPVITVPSTSDDKKAEHELTVPSKSTDLLPSSLLDHQRAPVELIYTRKPIVDIISQQKSRPIESLITDYPMNGLSESKPILSPSAKSKDNISLNKRISDVNKSYKNAHSSYSVVNKFDIPRPSSANSQLLRSAEEFTIDASLGNQKVGQNPKLPRTSGTWKKSTAMDSRPPVRLTTLNRLPLKSAKGSGESVNKMSTSSQGCEKLDLSKLEAPASVSDTTYDSTLCSSVSFGYLGFDSVYDI